MSGIATGTALMIAGGVGAAGSLGSAAMESSAAGKAANAEERAAQLAAQTQGQLGQEALSNEIESQRQNQANEQPFLQTGANSLATLAYLLGVNPSGTIGGGNATPGQALSIPGVNGAVQTPGVTPLTGTANTQLGAMGELMKAYPGGPFMAPTAEQARQEPGYQFALNQGENAVQAGAAANGSLLTGGTLNAEDQYAQGLADTNYNNIYNRALQTYNTNYNTWANNQSNQFNRLEALAGMGSNTAQTLGSQGIQGAGQVASTLANTGSELGQDYLNQGNAQAGGYINSANAWGGGISGAANGLDQMMMMQSLLNGGKDPYKVLYNAQNPDRTALNPTTPNLSGYQLPYNNLQMMSSYLNG